MQGGIMIGVSFARCAGWLHKADGGRGVILCSPHGFEELCARKSWKALADRLAAAGMPTLHFDYHGTADSDGSSDDPGRVDAWRTSIREAARWLEVNLGVTEIVIIGLRAGALLAALEAEKHGKILGLGLLAPVQSGRQYVRELKGLARIMAPPNSHLAKLSDARPGIDVCGFHERPETLADMESLNLAGFERAPARDVLLLSQKGANVTKLSEQLTRLGSRVTQAEFAGYEHMICDPTASRVPEADLDRVVQWAVSLAPMPERRARSVHRQDLDGDSWIETGVCFGPGRALTGVLCQPQYRQTTESPVIFLNSGMSYHIGWARMTVGHARALAAAGVPSLRIDCAGIGDSGAIFGLDEPPLYGEAAEASLVAAVDWLEAHGYENPTVVGACSGAYAAFHGLRIDPRIKRAAVVNLQCFRWTPSVGYELERWKSVRRAEITSQKTASVETAGFLSSLKARTLSTATSYVRRAGRIVKGAVRRGRLHVNGGVGQDVRAWFRDFSDRGCEVMMVYSAGDAGLIEFQHWTGPMGSFVTRLPGVSLRFIENADHNLTSPEARTALLQHLSSFMGVRAVGATPGIAPARQMPEVRYEMLGSGI
jgi:pimeloyl-ACP methyl ester carboxylesterase